MIKLIGALMILAAGAMIGFGQARRLRERPVELRRFIMMLQQLETEIEYGFTPLPEALYKLGRQHRAQLSGMMADIAAQLKSEAGVTVDEAWRRSVGRYWPSLAMNQEDREIIVQLGAVLGTSDREDQLKHLRLAVSLLAAREAEAAEERRKYEKMWKSLGLLGGALIAVILY